MSEAINFEITSRSSSCNARCGRVITPHGDFETPAFMPVGTKATVKGLLPDLVAATNSQILLNNTYHLMLRPGSELIQKMGGVHKFMRWDKPILTDSGGYQVYSMSHINKITDEGVVFKSIIDGSIINLTPERSIQIQNELGADIIMAFDDCPPSIDPGNLKKQSDRLGLEICEQNADIASKAHENVQDMASYSKRLELANQRTVNWLVRSVKAHSRNQEQGLFGIVQGGTDLELRSQSVEQICNIDLPGYAIGGVAVGEGTEQIARVVKHTAPLMPIDKPRYLMGVGYEWDILTAVQAGVDMFDCVLPTRNGRNSNAFTKTGQIKIRNAKYIEDDSVIDKSCDCIACSGGFSRAYLRHLFMADEMLGPILISLHNIHHFQRLMVDIRLCIVEDGWQNLLLKWPVLGKKSI